MARIEILIDKCTGCKKCIPSCPFSLIAVEDKKAKIMEGCTFCGACLEACPLEAILLEREEKEIDLSSFRGVWVFAEQRDGEIMPVTYELLGAGRGLADDLGESLSVILLGSNSKEKVKELLQYDLEKIYQVESPFLESYKTSLYTQAMSDLVRRECPEIILVGATSLGRDFAPRLATRLRTGLTADCTGLKIDGESGNLIQTRPALGGNIMASIISPYHRPQIATVRPKVMRKAEPVSGKDIEIIEIEPRLDEKDDLVSILNIIKEEYAKYCHTWSLCDSTCVRLIGPFLGKKGKETLALKTIDDWSNSDNLWIKRASMVILLKITMMRKDFDEDYVFELVEKKLKYSEENYIEKGIGWLLKTCSRYKPKVIFDYLITSKKNLSRLILRYASEK